MFCFESVFLTEVRDCAVFFLDINVVQLGTHIHADSGNVLCTEPFSSGVSSVTLDFLASSLILSICSWFMYRLLSGNCLRIYCTDRKKAVTNGFFTGNNSAFHCPARRCR